MDVPSASDRLEQPVAAMPRRRASPSWLPTASPGTSLRKRPSSLSPVPSSASRRVVAAATGSRQPMGIARRREAHARGRGGPCAVGRLWDPPSAGLGSIEGLLGHAGAFGGLARE
jgi:hypothetical protein